LKLELGVKCQLLQLSLLQHNIELLFFVQPYFLIGSRRIRYYSLNNI
jgi:hypothetical protein